VGPAQIRHEPDLIILDPALLPRIYIQHDPDPFH
jgi:hypothetical protein